MSLFPLVTFDVCTLEEANHFLVAWAHKMGPFNRGSGGGYSIPECHVLVDEGAPVAITVMSSLIRGHAGGGLQHLTRDNTIELARLCAARPHLCRAALRLWREFVFVKSNYRYALSYQDADVHTGHTYRFDGWKRSPKRSRSGTDSRSGKMGRNKWLWYYENPRIVA